MENLLLNYETKETFIAEWQDCYIAQGKITGFVCTFQLLDKKHIFYGLNDLQRLLRESKRKKKDVYLSLNAFEYGSRQTDSLKQIRNIGVDIDCYKLNIPISKALDEIHRLIIKGDIPNPNLVIFSGRGLQIVYSISGGASPKMAFLSQYITAQFIASLRHLGADTSATDVTRVFRLPGSVNSKNGKQVTVEIWRTMEYNLQDLYSYCKPLEKRRKPSKRQKATLHTLPSKKGLMSLYSLNTARKDDLEMLVNLRHGDIEKRNVLTYIYSYTVALILKNKDATISFSRQLNDRFNDPQRVKEVIRTTGNAYADAMKFYDEFVRRDFKMWYQDMDGIKRPMKNSTIIEELEITTDEMAHFQTIIDDEVKYQRKVQKRREQGIIEREEYLKQQNAKTYDRLLKLRELLEKNPKAKQKELAQILGVDRSYISKLKKQLKCEWSVL